jgi:hypothetical protein
MSATMDWRGLLAVLVCFWFTEPALADDKEAKSDDGEVWITIGGSAADKRNGVITIYRAYTDGQGTAYVRVKDKDTDPEGSGVTIEANDPGAAVAPRDDDGNPTGRVSQSGNDVELNRVRIKLPPGEYRIYAGDGKNLHFDTGIIVVRPGSEGKPTKLRLDFSTGITIVKPQDRAPAHKGAEGGNEPLPGRDRGNISND